MAPLMVIESILAIEAAARATAAIGFQLGYVVEGECDGSGVAGSANCTGT